MVAFGEEKKTFSPGIFVVMLSLLTFASIPCTIVREPMSSVRHTAAAVVFDGLLTRDDASAMSDYVRNELTGFYVFDRKDIKQASRIEQFLDQTLANLGDQSRWIEYWVGREWTSHPMHRDVDERMCFEQAINRFPRYGHVLYLSTDDNVTGGQTVVLSEGEGVSTENGVVLNGYKRRYELLPLIRTLLHLIINTLTISR